MPALELLGVRVHDLTFHEVLDIFQTWLRDESGNLHHVVTVNPEFIMTARRDAEFRDALDAADLATADGVGVVLASRLYSARIRERVTGVDLTFALAGMATPAPKLFLLGAGPGVAKRAADRLIQEHPDLMIAGVHGGGPRDEEAMDILDRIEESGANTLLVAFGAPAQEKWIARHRRALAACGIVIAIGVGGTFDYLAGNVPRAPGIVRRLGFEWLYRLVRQPWRWRRQLALPQFVVLVLRERLTGKY